MSNTGRRKDIVFVKSNLAVKFTDEKIYEKDTETEQELITASVESGKSVEVFEQERDEKVEKLIEENKKPRRAIKR